MANIRQPLKRGQRPRSQSVLCSEVLLYSNQIVHKLTIVSRKRAQYQISAHPHILP